MPVKTSGVQGSTGSGQPQVGSFKSGTGFGGGAGGGINGVGADENVSGIEWAAASGGLFQKSNGAGGAVGWTDRTERRQTHPQQHQHQHQQPQIASSNLEVLVGNLMGAVTKLLDSHQSIKEDISALSQRLARVEVNTDLVMQRLTPSIANGATPVSVFEAQNMDLKKAAQVFVPQINKKMEQADGQVDLLVQQTQLLQQSSQHQSPHQQQHHQSLRREQQQPPLLASFNPPKENSQQESRTIFDANEAPPPVFTQSDLKESRKPTMNGGGGGDDVVGAAGIGNDKGRRDSTQNIGPSPRDLNQSIALSEVIAETKRTPAVLDGPRNGSNGAPVGGRGVFSIASDEVKTVASKWKVLIVDALARKVINSCIKTSDILELNVTIVEMLELRRTPFPDLDAVYLLSPTPDSVELLLADYTRGKPPYAAAHLFFISGMDAGDYASIALSDTLFEKIQKSPIQRHVQTLKELNMDFLALEPQAFSLDLPGSLPSIINAQTPSHLKYELAPVAKRLVSVLATLGEYPYIRYYTPPTPTITPNSSNTPLIEMFAKTVQDELDELSRMDKSFPPASTFPRAILLLVDRGVDVVSPLLHEFTYQAMVHDCLTLEDGNKYPNKSDEGKLATLDEFDKIWVSQKYQHIAEVLQYLAEGVKKFSTENKAANFASGARGGKDQIADLKDTLNALPEYQEMKSKELVTGENSDQKPTKNIAGAVEALLANKSLCHEDRIRLLMLHIITAEGLSDSERQKLFDVVRLSREDYQAVTNLSMLGVRLSESTTKRGEKVNPYSSSSLKGGRGRIKEVKFENSRYIPIVKHMLEDQTKNVMDPSVFSWVKEPPPAFNRSAPIPSSRMASSNNRGSYDYDEGNSGSGSVQRTKPSWATSRAAGSMNRSASSSARDQANNNSNNMLPGTNRPTLDATVLRNNGPRVILFMLGGMTYSEMRSANEVMVENQREVLIGSTHVISPHSFLDTLKVLHKRGGPTHPSKSPYDPKLEPPPVVPAPASPRSKSRSGRGEDGRRRDDDPRVAKSKSDGRIDRYRDDRDDRGERYRDDRDDRGSSRGGYRDERGGGSSRGQYRDDRAGDGRGGGRDDGGSRSGYREDGGSRSGYRDEDRGNSRTGYRDDRDDRQMGRGGDGRGDGGRGGGRGGDRYGSEPALNTRSRSRDERGGRRDDLADRMERVNLDQPTKKKGWFGFGKK
ncbi:UNVERIFIED_CONTAM: vacuolar sorting protein VPS33/slp1 [Siphonaria sp. JEL0065]|nr:vacuolar sorting protein VPS33/slp1 [Siphonaria sp. JEL0065]